MAAVDDGDEDFGVVSGTESAAVRRRNVESVGESSAGQRPRQEDLAAGHFDPEQSLLVAGDDGVADGAVLAGIAVGGDDDDDRRVDGLALAQRNVVLARVERRPVVVDVHHLDLDHGCRAETTCVMCRCK